MLTKTSCLLGYILSFTHNASVFRHCPGSPLTNFSQFGSTLMALWSIQLSIYSKTSFQMGVSRGFGLVSTDASSLLVFLHAAL